MHRVNFTEALTSPLPLWSESELIIYVHIYLSIHEKVADDGQILLNFETTPKKDKPQQLQKMDYVGSKVVVIRKAESSLLC